MDAIALPADIPSLNMLPPSVSKAASAVDLLRRRCIDLGAVGVGGLTGVVGSVMPGVSVGADRKM